MSHLEERLVTRWSGRQVVGASLALGAVGVAPLALYVLLGPADGNPIGLGLLATASVFVAGLGLLVGVVKLLVERSRARSD